METCNTCEYCELDTNYCNYHTQSLPVDLSACLAHSPTTDDALNIASAQRFLIKRNFQVLSPETRATWREVFSDLYAQPTPSPRVFRFILNHFISEFLSEDVND